MPVSSGVAEKVCWPEERHATYRERHRRKNISPPEEQVEEGGILEN